MKILCLFWFCIFIMSCSDEKTENSASVSEKSSKQKDTDNTALTEDTKTIDNLIEQFEKYVNEKNKTKIIDIIHPDAEDFQYIKKGEFFESADNTSSAFLKKSASFKSL